MIRLLEASLHRVPLRLRMPFRFGIATLTEVTHGVVRARFELDGRMVTGVAADNFAPKWFRKDPAQPLAAELAELDAVVAAAFRHAAGVRAPTAFAFWRDLAALQPAWASDRIPPLLAQWGTSLVERALLHALARDRGVTTAGLFRDNLPGLDLGWFHPSLAGSAPRDWLPAVPAPAVFARHTVGLSDPVEAGDVASPDRLDDGLPQTVEENLRAYGLRQLKIKVNGELSRDQDRLARILRLVRAARGDDFAFSLDGNESFHDAPGFATYLARLRELPELRAEWPRLLFFEQPWHRDVALSVDTRAATGPDGPAVIIDESDAEPASLARALALGYAGTSHKNCKGILKGVAHACLLVQRRRAGLPAVLSGEDLTNVGPVALTQDLAVQAALGVTSVERNGHHYFAGLAQFPESWRHAAPVWFPELFAPDPRLGARTIVSDGRMQLASVNAAPFGVPGEPDFSGLPATALA